MKITKSELKKIIKEEAERYQRIKNLEVQKEIIKTQLNEMYEDYKNVEEMEDVNEDHTKNPNDKYVVKPCKDEKNPWAVWEGKVKVEEFSNKEEAEKFADKQNKEQGLDENVIEKKNNFIKESNINESVIRKIFKEEAERAEKIRNFKEMASEIIEEMVEMGINETEIEEGILGKMAQKAGLKDSPEEVEKRKKQIESNIQSAKQKGYNNFSYDGEKVDEATLAKKMEKNGYSGRIVPVAKKATLVYKPGKYGAGRLGSGGSSQGLGV